MTREEAIKIVRENMHLSYDKGDVFEALKTLVPELAKWSEDERIIKTLQEYVKNRNWPLNGPTQEEVLAWLEKQKETGIRWFKSDEVKNPDKPYIDKAGMFYTTDGRMCYASEIEKQKGQELISFTEPCNPDDYEVVMEGNATGLKKKEQKSTDEQFPPLEGLDAIKAKYYDDGFKNGFDEGIESVKPAEWKHYIWATNLRFDFTALVKYDDTDNYEIVQAGNRPKQEKNGVYILIKDIKPQFQWKPSEEQVIALRWILNNIPYNMHKEHICHLYEQLKKLM